MAWGHKIVSRPKDFERLKGTMGYLARLSQEGCPGGVTKDGKVVMTQLL